MFGDLWRFDSPAIGREFEWMRQWMDDTFRDFGLSDLRAPQGTFPRINLGSTDDAIQVYVFAPGLRAEDLDVSIENNVLTLRGRREPAGDDGITWYRRERPQGEFVRSISLPEGLDADAAEASFRNGVVTIRLPKTEALQPRRIEVKAA
ncbi:Hsp20/alpha crystallin family protein [Spiribacter halobius]|uniref:Heat-shock protein Hsp20 n=1 Tax=Sediminicurvatus halobius TaxID=2182432 RepID=A0A2U2N179_9GAMM|nr:Hsp20/alpha crystallin family protein [Spiribacter halobius]PWG62803.1 heat-shock protein Hsp20 [Spiribacter halobius]UEX77050.1 Hsp20/alpha crystallin family protein [Spiribacter halobius]